MADPRLHLRRAAGLLRCGQEAIPHGECGASGAVAQHPLLGAFPAADDRLADGRVRVPHFLGDDDIRGQPHDGLPDDFLPRFVDADLPRAGGDLRGALEKEDPAALYAGGIGGAIKQQNRPMVIRSVFLAFFGWQSAKRRRVHVVPARHLEMRSFVSKGI